MADGWDTTHALSSQGRLLEECPSCSVRDLGWHQCAFLGTHFSPNNWNCDSFAVLDQLADFSYHGSELEFWVRESERGNVLVWTRRVGQPQRVVSALVYTTKGERVSANIDWIAEFVGVSR